MKGVADRSSGDAGGALIADEQSRSALEVAFRDHYADVLAYAIRRLGDRARSEEAAAETFAIAWRRRVDLESDPLPWLYGVCRRVIANQLRSSRRQSQLRSKLARQPTPADADFAEAIHGRDQILSVLARLPETHREVLMLSAWEGLSNREGAAALGCSAAAYAVRLHRARRRLAKELGAAGQMQGGVAVSRSSADEGERT